MIFSTSIQNISAKVRTDSCVSANLHYRHHLSYSDWINKISLDVNTTETDYFKNHEVSYYDAISSAWKNITEIKKVGNICCCFINCRDYGW